MNVSQKLGFEGQLVVCSRVGSTFKTKQSCRFKKLIFYRHLPARYKELTGGKHENKGDDTKRTKAGSEGGKKGKKSSDDGEFKAMTKGHRRKKRSKSSQNLSAFWPGYMLDKLVMCIPLLDNGHFPWTQGSSTHFHYTGQPRHAYSAKYYV